MEYNLIVKDPYEIEYNKKRKDRLAKATKNYLSELIEHGALNKYDDTDGTGLLTDCNEIVDIIDNFNFHKTLQDLVMKLIEGQSKVKMCNPVGMIECNPHTGVENRLILSCSETCKHRNECPYVIEGVI